MRTALRTKPNALLCAASLMRCLRSVCEGRQVLGRVILVNE
jgi:hypothetical protein